MANGLLAGHIHPARGEVQLPVDGGLGTGRKYTVEDLLLLFRIVGRTQLLVDSRLLACEPTANRKRRLASVQRQAGESLELTMEHCWSEVRYNCRSQALEGFSNLRSLVERSPMSDSRLVSKLQPDY